jgi:hypothetical protein
LEFLEAEERGEVESEVEFEAKGLESGTEDGEGEGEKVRSAGANPSSSLFDDAPFTWVSEDASEARAELLRKYPRTALAIELQRTKDVRRKRELEAYRQRKKAGLA